MCFVEHCRLAQVVNQRIKHRGRNVVAQPPRCRFGQSRKNCRVFHSEELLEREIVGICGGLRCRRRGRWRLSLCGRERRRRRTRCLRRIGEKLNAKGADFDVTAGFSPFGWGETPAFGMTLHFDTRAEGDVRKLIERFAAENDGNEIFVAFAGHLVVFRTIDHHFAKPILAGLSVGAVEVAGFDRVDFVEYS
nr:MAG TPA: hypothetical protein [Caudoviricetes sp.]